MIICYDSSRKFMQLTSTKAGFLNDEYDWQIPRKTNQDKKEKMQSANRKNERKGITTNYINIKG